MSTELAVIDPKEYGLEAKQSTEITKNLTPILEERVVMLENYDKIIRKEISPELIAEARTTRLLIAKNRTQGIVAWHKVNKEFYLRGGQFCDAIKRKEIEVSERAEAQLLEIEQHFERIEARRLEDLQVDRENELSKYLNDDIERDLSGMADDVWNAFIATTKKNCEDNIAAEKKAEAEKIAKEKAEKAEQERIKKENETLKAEVEKKEKEAEALENKVKKEREASEAIATKKAEETAKVEAELKAKKDAEAKAIVDAKKAEKQAQLAPDKEKLSELVDTINSIEMPDLKTPEAEEIIKSVNTLLDKVTDYISKKSKEL